MSKTIIGIACAVLLALAMIAVAPAARADAFNQASQLTFNKPILLPGNTILSAGTYWFVLGDPAFAPNVVQVFNEDHTNLITTLMTDPTIRNERTDHSVLTLAEQSGRRPDALMDWYYADRLAGHQFLYSPRMEERFSEDPQITVVATNVPEKYDEEQATSRDKLRLRNADDVMQTALTDPDGIPQSLLNRAPCIVVMPSVFKAALVVGANYGRGVMVCRTGEHLAGSWGAPAMYALNGGSLGVQAGGQLTDYVFLVMNRDTMDKLLHGSVKLGLDASIAAGPVGRDVDAFTAGTDILTYSRTRGVFAGVALDGSTLRPDYAANDRLYGQTAAEIVSEPKVDSPEAARPLVALLDQSSPQLKS